MLRLVWSGLISADFNHHVANPSKRSAPGAPSTLQCILKRTQRGIPMRTVRMKNHPDSVLLRCSVSPVGRLVASSRAGCCYFSAGSRWLQHLQRFSRPSLRSSNSSGGQCRCLCKSQSCRDDVVFAEKLLPAHSMYGLRFPPTMPIPSALKPAGSFALIIFTGGSRGLSGLTCAASFAACSIASISSLHPAWSNGHTTMGCRRRMSRADDNLACKFC
jgi:hypothetical protein